MSTYAQVTQDLNSACTILGLSLWCSVRDHIFEVARRSEVCTCFAESKLVSEQVCFWLERAFICRKDKSAMQSCVSLQHMSVGTGVCIRCKALSATTCRPELSSGGAAPATAIPRTTAFGCQRPSKTQHQQLCRSSDRDAGGVSGMNIALSMLCGAVTPCTCCVDLEESMKNDMERLQRKQSSNNISRGQPDLRQVASALHGSRSHQ